MNPINVVEVKSDNFEGLMTYEAYLYFRLTLSTGDFHTHKHEIVSIPEDRLAEVIQLEDVIEIL